MNDYILDLKRISKNYPGIRALDQVDFAVRKGEIHCLMGENGSGKSTLIKVISGIVRPEPGAEILINGRRLEQLSSKTALDIGIHVIYQDLALYPNLTVKENIAFNRYIESGQKFVNWKDIDNIARYALKELGESIDINRTVGSLSIADQQLVEIARSLVGDLQVLIMDEPTSSLTRKEVQALFAVIKKLQQKGITTIFVSHKLNEIFEISERVTVLRDGKKVGVYEPQDLDHDRLTYLMTGQTVLHSKPEALADHREILLEARNLSKKGNFKNITFQLAKGEILGITGLLGSGRTELALALFGMNMPESGDILLEGRPVRFRSNLDALRAGIGYVPEHRMVQGLVMPQPIDENITITTIERLLRKFSLIDRKKQKSSIKHWVNELAIKIASPHAAVMTLSGGNQQKVVLSKWLATHPKVLILDEPTIGIDVLAKNSIHQLVKKLAESGMGIILISDEIPEVLHNCHRVLIMQKGSILHECCPEHTSEQELAEQFNLG
ncbi:lipase [candidate division KSB3 bacterium]|uniref:Lipase n=1 Tax=candidate division KSB3 bacterium TaxID=2044937 RepID=A0A2G6E2X9_9BACT|nr:MAG: lipase [candidate division KSB3 bacterium]PIE28879.1 MAG: lipase [candidate division KSB3 bacterium]